MLAAAFFAVPVASCVWETGLDRAFQVQVLSIGMPDVSLSPLHHDSPIK